ncbi:MAG: DMT family transporter [Acidimicrobiales bacterium]
MTSISLPTRAATTSDDAFGPGDWLLFLGIATIWGSSFFFIAVALESLQPGLITFLRVGLGALVLALLPGNERRPVEAADRSRFVALSVLWVALPFTLFPLAEQHINSAVTGLLNGGTPIFAAIAGTLWFGRSPRGLQLLGIAVGFVGVSLISAPSLGEGSSEALGVALVVLATMCYGVAINLAAPLQQAYGSVATMGRVLALASIWTLPFGLWDLRGSTFEWKPVLAIAVLGMVGTGSAFAIMATLVGRVGPQRASFSTYLMPAVSLAIGVTFQGDHVSPVALVGVVLVIGGALLASRKVSARSSDPGSV